MLFHSSIRKEMSRSFGATVVVLSTVVMTMLLIRTLGLASRGSVDPTEIMAVLAYTVLGHTPTILTLSLFVAIVATLSRMYGDSEMVIWFSSGQGLRGFLRPLFQFAWPILAVTGLLALFAWPWANQQSQTLRDRFEQRGDLERVTPGQFQESASGNRVFFVDKDSVGGKTAGQVFIAANEKGGQTITSARAGRVETIGAERYLLLSRGQRLEFSAARNDLKLSEFEEYGVRIEAGDSGIQRALPPRVLSTEALVANGGAANLGELSWRIGLALAAVNLVLIGLALASFNPRIGRNGNLIFALFAFILYFNLINLGASRIASQKSDFVLFMLGLHGSALLLAALLLAKQHWNWSVRDGWRRHRIPTSRTAVDA